MTKQQLMDYLRLALKLEGEIFTLKEGVEAYEKKIKSLGHPCSIYKRSGEYKELSDADLGCFAYIIIPIIGFALLGWFASMASCSGTSSVSYGLAIIAIVILPLYNLIARIINKCRKNDAENAAEAEYQKALQKDSERVNKENEVISHIKSNALEPAQTNIKNLEAALQKLYDDNVLYPTYRNMIAVAQILEYLESGVCDKLEGADGAYAQYLNDIRTERIVGSIDDLKKVMSKKLNSISLNQQVICGLLRTSNSILADINSSVGELQSSMYYMRETQCNANEYLKDMNKQLKRVADSYDKAAVKASAIAANQREQMLHDGISSYRIKYPTA